MNLNGFYALCCEPDGYAQVPWECPIGNQFSICIQFLPDALAVQGTLLSLSSIFSVKIDNEHIILAVDGIDYVSDETVLLQRCQNTVAVIYDGADIFIYCNGVSALQRPISFSSVNIPYLRIGEKLYTVCIRKVTIFHRQLTSSEIHISPVGKLSDFHRQIDFTSPSSSSDVTLHHCCIENCIYALDCSRGKLTMSHAYLPKEYTVMFSFYAFNHEYGGGILFNSPRMCIKLCDSYGLGSPRVYIEHDGHTHRTAFAIKTNQWVNLTVVFGSSQIKVYIDGIIKYETSYDYSSEKGNIEFGQFDGYLDSCTIIGCALSQNEISDYLNRPLDVFDKDVLYLFNFSDKLLQESCHGLTMTSSGAEIILAKGTGAGIRVDKSKRAPQSSRTYSDFVNWQICILLRLLVNWIYEQLGVYPNKGVRMDSDPWEIDVNLHHFIHKEILSMKEAQILLCHYNNLISQELLDLIQAMKRNGTFKKLIDYLYQDDDKQDSVSDILMALLAAAALLAALLAMLGKAITQMPPIPKPPNPPENDDDNDDDDDDDDDEKKKKTYVFIKQTLLKGNLRIEYEQKNISQDSERTAVFFVHANSSNPCLEASLSYKGDDGEFTVFAENGDSKVLPASNQKVSLRGNKSVKISLDIHPDEFKGKYGKGTETVRWRCESSDGEQLQFLGETSYEFYFLEKAPCKPWEGTVHIECLKLCAECSEYVGKKSEGFLKDYARFIQHKYTVNKYNADSILPIGASTRAYRKAYSKISASGSKKLIFDAVNFARDYSNGNRSISYDDLVYSNAVFGYLNGYQDIKVLWLSANMSYWSNDGKNISARLLLNCDTNLGGVCCLEDSIHYVMMDANNYVYDPKLDSYGLVFSDNNERKVTGAYNPSYYRESIYLTGSYCEDICSIDSSSWTLGNLSDGDHSTAEYCDINNLPENPIVGWVRPRVGGGYEHYGRTEKDPFVWNYIRNNDIHDGFNTVCHSISSYEIDVIIAHICTGRQENNLDLLKSLVDALYPIGRMDRFTSVYHQLTERIMGTLSRCLNYGNEYTDNVISHFCRLAANSPENLRMGNGRWNGAVGDAFDPKSWFYYDNPNAECVISDRGIDEACNQGHLLAILRERYNDIDIRENSPSGFYLPDRYDGIRIQYLLNARPQVKIICKCVIDPGPVFRPLIYSSSNQFGYEGDGDRYRELPEVFSNIYYRGHNNEWVLLQPV